MCGVSLFNFTCLWVVIFYAMPLFVFFPLGIVIISFLSRLVTFLATLFLVIFRSILNIKIALLFFFFLEYCVVGIVSRHFFLALCNCYTVLLASVLSIK